MHSEEAKKEKRSLKQEEEMPMCRGLSCYVSAFPVDDSQQILTRERAEYIVSRRLI